MSDFYTNHPCSFILRARLNHHRPQILRGSPELDAEHKELIKNLIPFNQMSEGDLSAALDGATVQTMANGENDFQARRRGRKSLLAAHRVRRSYLMKNLTQRTERQAKRSHETPLIITPPHRLTAVTTGDSKVLICDRASMAMHMGRQPWCYGPR